MKIILKGLSVDHALRSMPDLQPYTLNLHLINDVEDIVVFLMGGLLVTNNLVSNILVTNILVTNNLVTNNLVT